jgi:predicted DNA-binding transcriptional regulator AlpA
MCRTKLQSSDEKTPHAMGDSTPALPSHLRLVDLREVAGILSVSERTVLRLVQRREFPTPLRIGGRMLRWKVDVIEQWINRRVQLSTAGAQ